MPLRLESYLPKDSSGLLEDLREKFSIIEHYEIEEKKLEGNQASSRRRNDRTGDGFHPQPIWS